MSASTCFTALGIALQLLGAGYLLWQSAKTTKTLKPYTDVNYDNFSSLINQLKNELRSQFKHQGVGFLFLVVGSIFQLLALA